MNENPAPHSQRSHSIEIPKLDTKTVEEDEDVDLFGSESEDDEEADKIREERLAAYNAKKSKSINIKIFF